KSIGYGSRSDLCTPVCTSETKNDNAGPSVEALAAALRTLSPADRARLAALLTGNAAEPPATFNSVQTGAIEWQGNPLATRRGRIVVRLQALARKRAGCQLVTTGPPSR